MPLEAFHKPVLHWFAWRDVVPIDLSVFLPLQDSVAGQFGSIVADDHARISAHLGNAVQFTGHTVAGERCIDYCSQTFAAEVVSHVYNAEPAAARQAVGHEVQRPPLVRPLWDHHRCSGARRTLATTPFTDC